jgi:nicotinamidase-related amidase
MKNTLLVVIDLQNDFTLPGGKLPACTAEVDKLFMPLNAALAYGRTVGLPAVVLTTRWGLWVRLLTHNSLAPGSHGLQQDSRVEAGHAQRLEKPRKSAFSSPHFVQLLQSQDVQHMVLTGLTAEHCIAATTKDALARGIQVTLLTDAIASYRCGAKDAVFHGLASHGAKLVTTSAWIGAE